MANSGAGHPQTRSPLDGRVALVTGAASGIGRAVAERLGAEGVKVACADRDGDAAAEVAQAIGGLPLTLDVRRSAEIAAAVSELEARLGPLDILVNSAGIARDIPFLETGEEVFDEILAINVKGTLLCSQAAARAMQGRGGAIVNISSVSGQRGNLGRTAYGTSKAAVIGLTQVMAVELAPFGIRVNAVAPAPVDTPMVVKLHKPEERQLWTDAIAMRRYGRPEEIAAGVRFLVSDEASFVTGHVLNVDGGFGAAGMIRRP